MRRMTMHVGDGTRDGAGTEVAPAGRRRRGPTRERLARRGRRYLAVAVVMLAVFTPESARAASWPFQTYGYHVGHFASGPQPYIVLAGDSLIFNIGPQADPGKAVADHLRQQTGRGTYSSSIGGASWVTYFWPGQQSGNAVLHDYANLFRPRLTIAALGSNDARIMGDAPQHYNGQAQYDVMAASVNQTMQYSRCMLLVNTHARTPSTSAFQRVHLERVNNNMTWLAAVHPSKRVWVADWNAHAANRTGWFAADGIHLTDAGELYYAAFIGDWAKLLIAAGC